MGCGQLFRIWDGMRVVGAVCVFVGALGCGGASPERDPPIHRERMYPPVEQTGGGGFPDIQPGQVVVLSMSTQGLRLNDMPLPDEQLQSVLSDLVARGVLADVPVTVSIDKQVRVLERKGLLKRLEDQQIRYEVVEQ